MKKNNLIESPTFDTGIYEKLPELVVRASGYYSADRERDVFLLSMLTVCSSIIPGVYGIYNGDKLFANFNSIILAPAGSGKQAMNHTRFLIEPIHDKLKLNEKIGKYNQGLVIPGSSSPAAIIEHLNSNEPTNGLILETEIDTVSNVMKQEWGDYSSVLRQAFQHEMVSISRKKDFEHVEIKHPRLTAMLSGTPNQLENLLTGIEDGLFSRIAFYAFSQPPEWKEVFSSEKQNASEYFKPIAQEFQKLHENYSNRQVEFKFTSEQMCEFDQTYKSKFAPLVRAYGSHFRASVLRMGIIQFRIAMVLTAIRNAESASDLIVCSDADFECASEIADVLLTHAGLLVQSKVAKFDDSKTPKAKLYDFLPNEFTTNTAQQFQSAVGVRSRKISQYLAELLDEGLLISEKRGYYKKVTSVHIVHEDESDETLDE